jgi:hypothetical protein
MFGAPEKCSTCHADGFPPFLRILRSGTQVLRMLVSRGEYPSPRRLVGITGLIFGLFVDIFGWKYLTVFPILRTLYGLIVEENNVLGVGAYCSNDP